MRKILIKNARVFDGCTFFDSDVLVDKCKIVKIEKGIECECDYSFDAKGKTLCAGLVDIHAHIEGISVESFGIHAEMSCIPFGVTAANDASACFGTRELFDSHSLKLTAFVMPEVTENGVNFKSSEKMLGVLGDKAIGVKVFFDTSDPNIKNGEPLQEICEFAHKRGLKVMVHTSNSPIPMGEIVDLLSAGDIITHAFHGGKNNSSLDGYSCLIKAKQKGIVVDVGFAGFVHTDFAVLEGAIKAGVLPDTVSTDITKASAYMRGGRYGMTMCMSIAKELGMCEADIYKAVTVTPASVLGKQNEWACLKVGANADLAVFDFAEQPYSLTDRQGNTVCSDKGYRCVLTMVNGQILYKD